jgi:glycosyltransferase involved in cell wall biosynthesis
VDLRETLKRFWFGLLGKDPEAVIACFATGAPDKVDAMVAEMRRLVPGRRILVLESGSFLELRQRLSPYRIALAPVLFEGDSRFTSLRWTAFHLAPTRILAFNARLERHHLRLSTWIASWLFLRGVPLDRIWLRPWKTRDTVLPQTWRRIDGRPPVPGRPRIAVLAPYLPWPLSHGGAVRLWNLLRETARDFDIYFFGFEDGQSEEDLRRAAEVCIRLSVAAKPRYRQPRWSSLQPPEVCEFHSPALQRAIQDEKFDLLQVEYTQMASYGGDILVEHDVTFDLFGQVARDQPTLSNRWNLWRWRKFENRALRGARRVVVMSDKDAALVAPAPAVVIPNGVDLQRFQPSAETPGRRLLFIGSFRHFPNVRAYRFFVEQVWPLLTNVTLTVVAGPHPELYWADPPPSDRIRLLGFVADVKPLYDETNLVVIPTVVSAGTNLKALEAMAMERAMVSTPSGVAGLGLEHDESVCIAGLAAEFAAAIHRLLEDPDLRRQMARRARALAENRYGWPALAERQTRLWRELLP